MSLSLYGASVPVFNQTLSAQSASIDVAVAHCDTTGMEHLSILELRLVDDMFSYTQQIQRASFHACQAVAKLADIDIPPFTDDEKSFDDLKGRIQSALDFIKTVSPDKMEGREDTTVDIETRVGTLTFTGQDYLLHFALPQVLFHSATAHGILRHAGVDVTKRDFLGKAENR